MAAVITRPVKRKKQKTPGPPCAVLENSKFIPKFIERTRNYLVRFLWIVGTITFLSASYAMAQSSAWLPDLATEPAWCVAGIGFASCGLASHFYISRIEILDTMRAFLIDLEERQPPTLSGHDLDQYLQMWERVLDAFTTIPDLPT
jgi:hypothetical protein